MRNSLSSYQPSTAKDKWVPKRDRELSQMELERLHERALLLQKKIPPTSRVV